MKLHARLKQLAQNHTRHERKKMSQGTATATLPVFRIVAVGGGQNGEGDKMTLLTFRDHEGGQQTCAVPTADLIPVIAACMGVAPAGAGADKPKPSPIFKPKLLLPTR
jgi:acetyl-CoA carboxylase carboxyltransferase component